MIVLGCDFETNGLDPEKDRVLEIGAVLWDTANGGFPLRILSEFCYEPGLVVSEEITNINGITTQMLEKYGITHSEAFYRLCSMMDEAEAVVAHNGAKFDSDFHAAECGRCSLHPGELVWIDTAMDIKYPEKMQTRKLIHLASEHQFLNPFAHRAVFDVLTMLRVFQHYDPVAALELAKQPWLWVQALVSYDDNHLAKARGYGWKCLEHLRDRGEQCKCSNKSRGWAKSMRAGDYEIERQEAPFRTRIIE